MTNYPTIQLRKSWCVCRCYHLCRNQPIARSPTTFCGQVYWRKLYVISIISGITTDRCFRTVHEADGWLRFSRIVRRLSFHLKAGRWFIVRNSSIDLQWAVRRCTCLKQLNDCLSAFSGWIPEHIDTKRWVWLVSFFPAHRRYSRYSQIGLRTRKDLWKNWRRVLKWYGLFAHTSHKVSQNHENHRQVHGHARNWAQLVYWVERYPTLTFTQLCCHR